MLGTYAVRWADAARARVERSLSRLGSLTPIPEQRIFVLETEPSARAGRLEATLASLKDQRLIEFATPVLIDRGSRLRQILTDEITVRFHDRNPTRQLRSVRDKYGVTVARQNAYVPNQYVVKVNDASGLKTLEVARSLDRSRAVRFAAPNFISAVGR